MATSVRTLGDAERRRNPRWLWAALIALCVIGAIAVAGRIAMLASPPRGGPVEMAAINGLFTQAKGLTLVHVITALLFVAAVPFYFMRRLRESLPESHRRIGSALIVLGGVLGVTALIMSIRIPISANASAATILYGCFFLFSLVRAIWLRRIGDLALHEEWMMRAIGIALGVATTRPIMGVFFATSRLTGLGPHEFFGIAFWIGFTVTYIGTEAWIRVRREAIVT